MKPFKDKTLSRTPKSGCIEGKKLYSCETSNKLVTNKVMKFKIPLNETANK